MKITKEIIAKLGADLAREYAKYTSEHINEPSSYEEWLFELSCDSAPSNKVEMYLWKNGELDEDDDLVDYVATRDYIDMIEVVKKKSRGMLFDLFDPTDFELTFNEWFCIELKELMNNYNFDLQTPVDVNNKEETTINELDKAKAVLTDKNNSFAKMEKASGASIPTLKAYRADPEKLKTARWITVHKLASMYNKQEELK